MTGKKTCRKCFIEVTKPYVINIKSTHDVGACGGTDFYKITPKIPHLRLHNIIHYEYVLPMKSFASKDFHAINHWDDVWDVCDGWATRWREGSLIRGLREYDGNGIVAIVEDSTGIYLIHGVWG